MVQGKAPETVPGKAQEMVQGKVPGKALEKAQEKAQERAQGKAQAMVQEKVQEKAPGKAQEMVQGKAQKKVPGGSRESQFPTVRRHRAWSRLYALHEHDPESAHTVLLRRSHQGCQHRHPTT
jgi:hypothetical protein